MNVSKSLFKKLVLPVLSVIAFCSQANAQFEPQFTQYMFNEMYINPAYAGSRDHLSMTGLYRNQWVGIKGAPVTETFSANTPLKNEKIGVGLTFMHEEIGVTKDNSIFATYAYRLPIQNGVFSMGVQAGLINHQEQLVDVKTQDQNDYAFFGTPKVTVPNVGYGMYYRTNTFYCGLSIPRMLQNKVDGNTGKATNTVNMNYWHYYFMGGYVFTLNENVKLKPTFMIKEVTGAPLEADLGAHILLNEIVWFGASVRTGDSWALITQFQLTKQMRLGYSYDYTTTSLNKYNSGTHEITLGYDFSFIKDKIVTPRYF